MEVDFAKPFIRSVVLFQVLSGEKSPSRLGDPALQNLEPHPVLGRPKFSHNFYYVGLTEIKGSEICRVLKELTSRISTHFWSFICRKPLN